MRQTSTGQAAGVPTIRRYTTVEHWIRKGIAADHVKQFDPSDADGKRFCILARVSSHQQGKKFSLNAQAARLREAIEDAGGTVALVCKREWSGRGQAWIKKLHRIADKA
jgi:hypothetical protein